MENRLSIFNLLEGKTCRVTKKFIDYDKGIHKIGEVWIFDKTISSHYDSGVVLFVIKNGQNVTYRFQSYAEEQRELSNTFMNYVEQIEL
jgi:Domain of unknown function (DUF3601)